MSWSDEQDETNQHSEKLRELCRHDLPLADCKRCLRAEVVKLRENIGTQERYFENLSPETIAKSLRPIACIFVVDHSRIGRGNKIVGGEVYSPSLSPGEYDVYYCLRRAGYVACINKSECSQ